MPGIVRLYRGEPYRICEQVRPASGGTITGIAASFIRANDNKIWDFNSSTFSASPTTANSYASLSHVVRDLWSRSTAWIVPNKIQAQYQVQLRITDGSEFWHDLGDTIIVNDSHGIGYILQLIHNKKDLVATGATYKLVARNESNSATILRKRLVDKDGNNISARVAGVICGEVANEATF